MWWDVDELWCGVASSELRLPRFIVDDGRIPEAKALFDDGTPFQRRNADRTDLTETAGLAPFGRRDLSAGPSKTLTVWMERNSGTSRGLTP